MMRLLVTINGDPAAVQVPFTLPLTKVVSAKVKESESKKIRESFFISISILTLMSLILVIEGQYFHLFIGTRCEISSIGIQSQYCESYFGLMIGIVIAATFQMYIYWHYITSLKSRLFPKDN